MRIQSSVGSDLAPVIHPQQHLLGTFYITSVGGWKYPIRNQIWICRENLVGLRAWSQVSSFRGWEICLWKDDWEWWWVYCLWKLPSTWFACVWFELNLVLNFNSIQFNLNMSVSCLQTTGIKLRWQLALSRLPKLTWILNTLNIILFS